MKTRNIFSDLKKKLCFVNFDVLFQNNRTKPYNFWKTKSKQNRTFFSKNKKTCTNLIFWAPCTKYDLITFKKLILSDPLNYVLSTFESRLLVLKYLGANIIAKNGPSPGLQGNQPVLLVNTNKGLTYPRAGTKIHCIAGLNIQF